MRPALAEVLAVVTPIDLRTTDALPGRRAMILEVDRVGLHAVTGPSQGATIWHRWTRATPADALAALVEAELLPAQWSDPERAPRWWCERCAGVGRVTLRSIDGSGDLGSYAVTPDAYGDLRCDAFDVSGAPPCGAPPSLPALVAVASLGVDTLARAEAIVAEAWRARVVWRVMGAEKIREHRWSAYGPVGPPRVVAELLAVGAYPLSRDGDRVTLGVEALP